jgi:hypothetical protein
VSADLEALVARIEHEGWRVVPIVHEPGSVRVVRANGSYVAVSLPADAAAGLLAIPAMVARLDRLERRAAIAVGCLDDRVGEVGGG